MGSLFNQATIWESSIAGWKILNGKIIHKWKFLAGKLIHKSWIFQPAMLDDQRPTPWDPYPPAVSVARGSRGSCGSRGCAKTRGHFFRWPWRNWSFMAEIHVACAACHGWSRLVTACPGRQCRLNVKVNSTVLSTSKCLCKIYMNKMTMIDHIDIYVYCNPCRSRCRMCFFLGASFIFTY